MFLGATNFVLLYTLTQGQSRPLRESEELRFYAPLPVSAAVVTSFVLAADGTFAGPDSTVRHALFQVTSILTTTGYASTDFNMWSPALKHLLFLLMIVGGMAGSTTCSIKTVRWLVVLKSFPRELSTEHTPEAVRPLRLSGDVAEEDTLYDILLYVLLSVVIFTALTVVVVVDASRAGVEIGEFEAMGAAASAFLNIGPAFGAARPYASYAVFPTATKPAMIFLMWIGRIEVIPVLVLLSPRFWRS